MTLSQLLADVKKLDEAATRGSWRVSGQHIIQTDHITRDIWEIATQGNHESPGDMPLIAHYRTSAPILARIVERMRDALERYNNGSAGRNTALNALKDCEKIAKGETEKEEK